MGRFTSSLWLECEPNGRRPTSARFGAFFRLSGVAEYLVADNSFGCFVQVLVQCPRDL
jgi:hypothetical protein